MVHAGAPTRPGGSPAPRASTTAPSQGSSQGRNVTAPAFNAHADRSLLQRFRDSSHSTISSMMSGQSLDIIPKHNGNPVCLTWALKDKCSHGCRRANQHVRSWTPAVQRLSSRECPIGTQCPVPRALLWEHYHPHPRGSLALEVGLPPCPSGAPCLPPCSKDPTCRSNQHNDENINNKNNNN